MRYLFDRYQLLGRRQKASFFVTTLIAPNKNYGFRRGVRKYGLPVYLRGFSSAISEFLSVSSVWNSCFKRMKQLFQAYETVVSGVWNSIFKGLRNRFKAENTGYIRFISFFSREWDLSSCEFCRCSALRNKEWGAEQERIGLSMGKCRDFLRNTRMGKSFIRNFAFIERESSPVMTVDFAFWFMAGSTN